MRKLPMWELLASDKAPETLSCLQLLLFDNEKSLPASVFISRLTDYLNEFEDVTIEPSQAAAKANLWRKSNFITLRYSEGQQEPVYELSSAAHEAIRFISSQRSERTSPTESRLELVIHAIRKLVLDTDVNIEDRVALLEEDRRRIEEQIAFVRQGKVDVASEAEVRAQIFDLLEMIENLNGDFYRVRESFYELSRELHEDIMRNDGTAGNILEGFFAGYDRISESEEGKTFRSFYNFINVKCTNLPEQKPLEFPIGIPTEKAAVQDVAKTERWLRQWKEAEACAIAHDVEVRWKDVFWHAKAELAASQSGWSFIRFKPRKLLPASSSCRIFYMPLAA